MYEKVVVTKGIPPPHPRPPLQPLHHSRGKSLGEKKNILLNANFFPVILIWDKDKIFPNLGDAQIWIPVAKKEKES